MIPDILHVDRNRLDEINFDELDDKYNLHDETLLRLGPVHDINKPNEITYDVQPEDDDVFLTEEETRLLFPSRYDVNPASLEADRNAFYKKMKMKKYYEDLEIFFDVLAQNSEKNEVPSRSSARQLFSPQKSKSRTPVRSPKQSSRICSTPKLIPIQPTLRSFRSLPEYESVGSSIYSPAKRSSYWF